MRKYLIILMLMGIVINLFGMTKVLAFSDEFTLMLEVMDIPKQNKSGLYINEEIYNVYNLFVYGSPLNKFSGQRWKDVSNGNWTKNSGVWKGNGIRGEYWILGENYYGKEVHNHKFPVDIEPPTAPTEWRYAVISDALESWQESERYMDDFQKEYMLTQKLMRNDNVYDMTVQDIGLDKARLENYATWKTKGNIYTQRYDKNNKKWAANFMVAPMAADADLEGYAIFEKGIEYYIEEPTDIAIPIVYGAKVINLTEYAKEEHVKEIKSQLYINGILLSEVFGSKQMNIEKNTIYNFAADKYQEGKLIALDVQIKSTLMTKFITDGALVDTKNYTIYINCGGKIDVGSNTYYNDVSNDLEIPDPDSLPPIITRVEIKRIVDRKELPLLVSKKTGTEFICAGQTIKLKIKTENGAQFVTIEFEGDSSISRFDELTKRFEWTEPIARNEKTFFNTLKEFEKLYKSKYKTTRINRYSGEFECTYIVPYQTKQTLESWETLREKSKDAFEINESHLFSRIQKPYEIVLKAIGPTGITTKRIKLDVFERWDTLYNRNLEQYIK